MLYRGMGDTICIQQRDAIPNGIERMDKGLPEHA